MISCATYAGRSPDASLVSLFGIYQHLITVDSEAMEFETLENPSVSASGCAGHLV